MKWVDLFEKWEIKNIKLNLHFADLEFQPSTEDADAAWQLYVELITRITIQTLIPEEGDEKTALSSINSLFEITRDILKKQGRKSHEFTKLSIIILNQVIRPFTAKWHKLSLANAFEDENKCIEFRKDLADLQVVLKNYTKLLSNIAGVEDLTELD